MKRKKIFAIILALVSSVAAVGITTPSSADELNVPVSSGAVPEAAKKESAPSPAEKKAEVFTYVVVRHDTLWDISKRHLNNPFKWPSIWKLNPQIKNPDLIYPGDMVRIAPGGETAAVEAEAAVGGKKESAAAPQIEEGKKQDISAIPVVALEPEKRVVLEPPQEEAAAQKAAPAAPQAVEGPKIGSGALERKGFVSNYDLESSGVVLESKEKKQFVHKDDEVYVSFKNKTAVKAGNRYLIYVVGEKITHPKTKKSMGFIVDILGSLAITKSGRVLEGKIDKSFKEIAVGSKLMAYKEPVKEVLLNEGAPNVSGGYILASLEGREFLAKGDVVYIDKGRTSGLNPGNKVRIYRPGEFVYDPVLKKSVELPETELGELVMLEVGEATSSGIITKSLKAINVADRVGGAQ